MTETADYTCTWSIGYTDYDGTRTGADCDAVATVLLYDPADDAYAAPRPFGFCSHHAATETFGDGVVRVAIADLTVTCTSCRRPVWAAHAEEHEIGRDHRHETGGICRDATPDHAPCACPEEAAYEAAMHAAVGS